MDAWLGELRPYAGEARSSSGWRLAKSAWRLLRTDRAIGLATALGTLALAVPLVAAIFFADVNPGLGDGSFWPQTLLSAMTSCAWTFAAFAIAFAADAAVDEIPMDLREALEEAREHLGPVLGWALLTLAVWLAARIVGQALDSPWLTALVGVPWYLLTTFAVAAMVTQGIGPGEAVGESLQITRDRWRETLAGLFGIVVFTALASFPSGAVLSHAAALNHGGQGIQYPWLVAGALLLAVALALSLATREVFAILLLREELGDLPGREYGGRRLRRRAKAARVGGAIVAVLIALVAYSALTEGDREVLDASNAPGANYTTIVHDPSGAGLPDGSTVYYREAAIGEVLGTRVVDEGLSVTFHVEPGYGPDETPGSFVIVNTATGPYLVLVPSGDSGAPSLSRS